MTVSVLICTYNRHELLRLALAALVEGTTEKPDEIVVVNGGDERADSVVEACARQQPTVRIKLIKTVNKNLAASRNVGLPHCSGDIIAWTDDDAEVFPDWVTQLKRLHAEHPEAGGIGGAIVGENVRSFVSRLADQVTFISHPTARYVRTVPGVNASYKRRVVEQVGMQDETLFRGEDVDYNWRIKQLGFEIYYDPGPSRLAQAPPYAACVLEPALYVWAGILSRATQMERDVLRLSTWIAHSERYSQGRIFRRRCFLRAAAVCSKNVAFEREGFSVPAVGSKPDRLAGGDGPSKAGTPAARQAGAPGG